MRSPAELPVSSGVWHLVGSDVVAELTVERSSCALGIWGPTFRAGEGVSVPCGLEEREDGIWVHFPLEMGAGEGMGVLVLGESTARLPLGARPGEWEWELLRATGPLEPGVRTAAIAQSEVALRREKLAWQDGRFRLLDGDSLVGALSLGTLPGPTVEVFDAFWATPGPQEAMLMDDGPDLVLEFEVEPSFQGEGGVLRVNRLVGAARVPLAEEPSTGDRLLALVPGPVTDAERDTARARAVERAGQKELEVVLPLASQLRLALAEQGCAWNDALRGRADLLLVGYGLKLEQEAGACVLLLEPGPVQHGRRLAARLGAEGPPEWVLRNLP